jgi:hypothetical protein
LGRQTRISVLNELEQRARIATETNVRAQQALFMLEAQAGMFAERIEVSRGHAL